MKGVTSKLICVVYVGLGGSYVRNVIVFEIYLL